MAIMKSSGVTATERMLADFADRSFLRAWSYPNPVKDDRKELCDLLAVFENHVFIFFDRENRQLDKADADPMVSWKRWKRDAIDAQIQTARGAERYIRSGRAIFLDAELKVPFPIAIDPTKMIVHKIIVAHGAAEACKAFSDDNVSGSLAIAYGDKSDGLNAPFLIELDREDPVHVFDTHTLPIVLEELDTIFDLSTYLDAKVRAIGELQLLSYCGEEDLLAHYFVNFDGANNRHRIGTDDPTINAVFVGEGEWRDFTRQAVYRRKKKADKVSYLWDDVLQRTTQNALDGTLLGNADVLRGRSAVHEMAKEPRFSRRELSAAMIKAIETFPEPDAPIVRKLSFMPSFYRGKGFVFLQLKWKGYDGDYENDYRPKRRRLLEIACGAARNRMPDLTTVVGIAIDAPKFSRKNAEDFILMDCTDWTDERAKYYEEANAETMMFATSSMERVEKTISEFPKAEPRHRPSKDGRIPRHGSCSCGSGKPWRLCHGRR
jgi:hypothetical protein